MMRRRSLSVSTHFLLAGGRYNFVHPMRVQLMSLDVNRGWFDVMRHVHNVKT